MARSQVYNGYTYEKVKQQYPDKKTTEGKTNSGVIYQAYYANEYSSVIYYFDGKKICNQTRVLPGNELALKALIEYCNQNYVVISDTQWKWYTEDGIYDVKLIKHNEKYFVDYFLQNDN